MFGKSKMQGLGVLLLAMYVCTVWAASETASSTETPSSSASPSASQTATPTFSSLTTAVQTSTSATPAVTHTSSRSASFIRASRSISPTISVTRTPTRTRSFSSTRSTSKTPSITRSTTATASITASVAASINVTAALAEGAGASWSDSLPIGVGVGVLAVCIIACAGVAYLVHRRRGAHKEKARKNASQLTPTLQDTIARQEYEYQQHVATARYSSRTRHDSFASRASQGTTGMSVRTAENHSPVRDDNFYLQQMEYSHGNQYDGRMAAKRPLPMLLPPTAGTMLRGSSHRENNTMGYGIDGVRTLPTGVGAVRHSSRPVNGGGGKAHGADTPASGSDMTTGDVWTADPFYEDEHTMRRFFPPEGTPPLATHALMGIADSAGVEGHVDPHRGGSTNDTLQSSAAGHTDATDYTSHTQLMQKRAAVSPMSPSSRNTSIQPSSSPRSTSSGRFPQAQAINTSFRGKENVSDRQSSPGSHESFHVTLGDAPGMGVQFDNQGAVSGRTSTEPHPVLVQHDSWLGADVEVTRVDSQDEAFETPKQQPRRLPKPPFQATTHSDTHHASNDGAAAYTETSTRQPVPSEPQAGSPPVEVRAAAATRGQAHVATPQAGHGVAFWQQIGHAHPPTDLRPIKEVDEYVTGYDSSRSGPADTRSQASSWRSDDTASIIHNTDQLLLQQDEHSPTRERPDSDGTHSGTPSLAHHAPPTRSREPDPLLHEQESLAPQPALVRQPEADGESIRSEDLAAAGMNGHEGGGSSPTRDQAATPAVATAAMVPGTRRLSSDVTSLARHSSWLGEHAGLATAPSGDNAGDALSAAVDTVTASNCTPRSPASYASAGSEVLPMPYATMQPSLTRHMSGLARYASASIYGGGPVSIASVPLAPLPTGTNSAATQSSALQAAALQRRESAAKLVGGSAITGMSTHDLAALLRSPQQSGSNGGGRYRSVSSISPAASTTGAGTGTGSSERSPVRFLDSWLQPAGGDVLGDRSSADTGTLPPIASFRTSIGGRVQVAPRAPVHSSLLSSGTGTGAAVGHNEDAPLDTVVSPGVIRRVGSQRIPPVHTSPNAHGSPAMSRHGSGMGIALEEDRPARMGKKRSSFAPAPIFRSPSVRFNDSVGMRAMLAASLVSDTAGDREVSSTAEPDLTRSPLSSARHRLDSY